VKVFASLGAASLLAGCSPSPIGPTELANPIGQWQVESIDGAEVDPRQPPIFVSIGKDWAYASSQCVWWRWSWKGDGKDGFALTQTPFLLRSEPNAPADPVPMCARGFSSQEQAFESNFEDSTALSISDDTLLLKSKGSKLKLTRRPNIEGRWEVNNINGNPITTQDYPIHLTIADGEIYAASQCVWWRWNYNTTGKTLTKERTDLDVPICERGRSATEIGFERAVEDAETSMLGTDQRLTFKGRNGGVDLQIGP
jgi:heat shock protein HslJ